MDFRWDIVFEYMPYFIEGAMWTIVFSLVAIFIGTILGLFIGLGRMSEKKIISYIFVWYINFFRGTPIFVQILLIHFGAMPYFMNPVSPAVSLTVALTLNAAAYIAEIFRAGIQSIDKGQMEAARSLGMTKAQTMWHIIIPQAFKRMIPPLGNEFIALLKESSLGAVIAAPELMYWGRAASSAYYRTWEAYLPVAAGYLMLTLTLTYLLTKLEKRFNLS
jgi:polar amino acid transport system permease protein